MFNKNGRTKNVLKSSLLGTICSIFNTLLGFAYRTIFLHVLSASYLGINGLFTNILQILSFADLGISSVIIFRFYEPISQGNINKVGRLMYFFKNIYRIIAAVIISLGLILIPFINFFIKDINEIPSELNLRIVYLLFLLQTTSSYLFIYKQTILNADQKEYVSSLVNSAIILFRYIFQMVVLLVTKNFILVLITGIVWTILSNYLFSKRIEKKYKDIFKVKENISKIEKIQIFSDTKASLCHKIGGTVLTSTDSIIISKYIGIISTGLYSNYALVFSGLSMILGQLLGNFTSSLGNAHVEQSIEEKYKSYRRLLFANLWITSVCSVCMFTLVNDLITVWIGRNMLLSPLTVAVLSLQFFVETSRIISTSYTNASGLFIKDKIRPLIESFINLTVSILLAKKIGIAGVFIGTIFSHLCTVSWREPYLLYKYEFKRHTTEYWLYYAFFMTVTLLLCVVYRILFNSLNFFVSNLFLCFFKACFVFITSNCLFFLCFCKNENLIFYIELIKKFLKKRGNKENHS